MIVEFFDYAHNNKLMETEMTSIPRKGEMVHLTLNERATAYYVYTVIWYIDGNETTVEIHMERA